MNESLAAGVPFISVVLHSVCILSDGRVSEPPLTLCVKGSRARFRIGERRPPGKGRRLTAGAVDTGKEAFEKRLKSLVKQGGLSVAIEAGNQTAWVHEVLVEMGEGDGGEPRQGQGDRTEPSQDGQDRRTDPL